MSYAQRVIDLVKKRDPGQPEFHQAVSEVLESLEPALERNPKYEQNQILERIVEPERQLMFRVPWVDDKGEVSQFPGFTAFRNPLGDFIDSDQAMAAAVATGLKTNTFGMKMSLKSTDHAEWFIPGSDLSFTIDAVTGKLLSKE